MAPDEWTADFWMHSEEVGMGQRRWWMNGFAAVMVALLVLAGCGDPQPADPVDTDDNDCQADCDLGETRCDGDGAVEACTYVDGCPAWTEAAACDGDQICDGGRCVDDPEDCDVDCEIGTSQCRGNGVEFCVEVQGCPDWSDPIECEDELACSDGACVAECDDECTPGDRSCEDTGSYKVCEYDADGCAVWAEPTECSEFELCSAGQCISDCDDECSQGETQCDGDGGFQLCQMQPEGCMDWSETIDCPGELNCEDGACIDDGSGDDDCTDACTGGDTQCDGDSIAYCQMQTDGCYDWSPSVTCPDTMTCDGGACVPDCTDDCTDGATRCDGSGAFEVCQSQSDGCLGWSESLSCPADLECVGGDCIDNCTDQCTEGDSQCDGDSVQVCQEMSNGCTDWTDPIDCSGDLTCDNGQCVATCTDQCTDEGATRCGAGGVELCQQQSTGCLDWSGPFGCPDGTECDGGECLTVDDDACSADNPDGYCPDGEICDDGTCITEDCSSENPDGICPSGQICDGGTCIDDPLCNCASDEVCVDGQCHPEDDGCSADNPNGLCDSGYDCIEGECVADNECSSDNPGGVCPTGQWCDDGQCEEIDDEPLCTDRNGCTANWFDYSYNLCLTADADANSCDDGNPCTDNWCDGGECQSSPISGCDEPPEIDPYPARTNDNNPTISGTKPTGSGIKVDGIEVVSENQNTYWEFNPTLDAGENVYEVQTFDGSDESEIQEVTIYYDNVAPDTLVTPDGGTFLDGINVQVITSEPADVYYTTDGTTPTSSSESFRSIRQFRVFEPTELKFLARDDAGNWEEEVTTASFNVTSYANRWSDGPDLWDALRDAAAAVVDDTVYVAGGTSSGSAQADAQGWDIDDEQWTSLPALSPGRTEASMVQVDGYLYLIGGENSGTVFNSITRIDPGDDTDDWTGLAGMPTDRYGLEAVAVDDQLFVFGGKDSNDDVVSHLEVYTIPDDNWSNQFAQMPRERYDFEAVLHNDLIYLFGGVDDNGDPIDVVDVYDPDDDTWSTVEPMPTARSAAAAGVIRGTNLYNASFDSVIVVAGGLDENGEPTPVVEEYDPTSDSWTVRTPLSQARHSGASAAFDVPGTPGEQHRELWIAGGETVDGEMDDTVTYSRDLEYKRHLDEMPQPRFDHSATSWNDRIYIVGGQHEGNQQDVWAFDPETGSYIDMPDLPQVQNGLGTAALGEHVYAIGGENQFGTAVSSVYALDPVQQVWQQKASMSSRKHPAVTVVDDVIYAIGGYSNGVRQSVEIYDPEEDNWTPGPTLNEGRTGAMATVHDGDLYVLGGVDDDGDYVQTVERLPDGTGSWETVSGVSIEAAHGAAFSLGDDVIAVLGGRPDLDGDIWLYDLAEDTAYNRTAILSDLVDRAAATYHHGRLYMFGGNTDADDPGPGGTVTARKFDLHGCVEGSAAVMPGWCTGLAHEPLHLVDYTSGTDGTGGNYWRGYRFQVSEPVNLTGLYGGGTSSGFHVAFYEASYNTPTELLVDIESDQRRQELVLDEPIWLEPGNDYIIAQGRVTGGGHYTINSISRPDVEEHSAIEWWNPSASSDSLSFGTSGEPEDIIGISGSSNTTRPDMGLGFN